MFNTCFVCSVVVSGGHKNKRPFFPLSLSQSWNKWDKHNWAKNGRPVLKIEKKTQQQLPSVDRFRNGVALFLTLYPSHQSSQLATKTVHFCEICVRLLYHILSAVTPSCIVQLTRDPNWETPVVNHFPASLCHDGFFARHVATCSSPRVKK